MSLFFLFSRDLYKHYYGRIEIERVRKMDEFKLNLSTKFMRGILAKLISRKIKKQYGYKIDIYFSEIKMDMLDGQTHLHVNVDLDMNSDEFKKLLKSIDED
jgi:hypothetical protein